MRKILSILLIILMLVTSMVACSNDEQPNNNDGGNNSQNEGDKAKEKIMRFGSQSAPSGILNPLYIMDDYTGYVTNLIFEPLVTINPDFLPEGVLAESWEVSDDSRSVTFKLRKGIKWHDGTPFTSEDVKFTYEFLAHKDQAGPKSSVIAAIDGFQDMKDGKVDYLKGVEVIDENTVKITTTEVFAPFFEKLCKGILIIPKHIWSQVEVGKAGEATELLKNPVGTGPFKINEFVADRYTIVEKNKEYWAGEPKLDKIVIQAVNADTAQAQMINGELDFIILSSLNKDELKAYEDAGLQFVKISGTTHQKMVVNNRNPLLSNKYVRQALAYGIDRQGILDTLAQGYGTVANTTYPVDFWTYPSEDEINKYEYNPEKAIELLTQKAGWEYKNNIMYANGEPVKFTISYPIGNKPRELSAPVIQENLKNIGIEVELELLEFATLLAKLKEEQDDAFDLALLATGIGSDPDVKNYFHTDAIFSGSNRDRYSNPEVDRLIEEGLKYLEPEKRKPIYEELALLINEEMPTIFLYHYYYGAVISDKLRNITPTENNSCYHAHLWEFAE